MARSSLVLDLSAHQRHAAHSMLRELEWSVRHAEQADHVEVVPREIARGSMERVFRNATRLTAPTVAGLGRRRPHVGGTHDVAFAAVISFRDLWVLGGVDLRTLADRRICYILELWGPEVRHFDLYRRILDQFDAVFTVHRSSVEPLRAAISAPVHWLPTGSDTALHVPPTRDERGLDVLSIGRRCAIQHEELVLAARDGVLGYRFDSLGAGPFADWQQHRLNLAGEGQRARFYVAHRAKFDVPVQSGVELDFGNRFFDAAAAGSIPVGEIPHTPTFVEYFPAAAEMVVAPTGRNGIVDAVLARKADPERCRATSTSLMVDALRRHDWAHRWRTMLAAVDLEPLPSTIRRIDQLADLADLIARDEPHRDARAALVREQWHA